ncbi:hypothetical protein WR25_17483 [Diploscapter pachys]|uniref:Uncharacterized protein n=1 Tax=Diploscapter pachys TaxID=2018661 RepID=A0A2A2L6F4_9BILA|nr:hypothetical protein WR25_17483 [Diploscapter pachys]
MNISPCLTALVWACSILVIQAEKFLLYRITPSDMEGLKWLNKVQVMDHKYKLDFWKEARRLGDHADIMISDKTASLLETQFQRRNISYAVTVSDVEKLIMRNEGHVYEKKSSWLSKRLKDDPILDSEPDTDHSHVGKLKKAKYPFGDYAAYADMMKYMRTIEFYYPNITKIIRLGTSHEGKPIEGLKIGFPNARGKRKRAIWIDGNIHAREWASSHTALFAINQLVSGYGKDEIITYYLNNLDFYIVPCLNPDGYEYTRSSPIPSVRLWRKNRSPEVCRRSSWGGEKCCRGVDLNRNFHFHWAETGSSSDPCSNIYHGDTVFSEPEALAVRDFLHTSEMRSRVDAFITLHSYAQLWIYPYSHQEGNYPDDVNDLRRTARKAITKLARMYGTQYRMGTGADTLAPASGGSDDWAKGTLGVKYVYLIELRPQFELSNGFILHKKELIPTAIETFEGFKEVIEAVLEHNNLKRDPVTRISPNQRKKQLYRWRILGLPSSIGHNSRHNDTRTHGKNKGDIVHLEKTFSTYRPGMSRLLARLTTRSSSTSTSTTTTTPPTGKQKTILSQDERRRLLKIRLNKYSTKLPDYSTSAESITSTTPLYSSREIRWWTVSGEHIKTASQELIRWSSKESSKSTSKETTRPSHETSKLTPNSKETIVVTSSEVLTSSSELIEGPTTPISLTSSEISVLESTEAPRTGGITRFSFYTNRKPESFMDPECRDMRYSCGFWVKHNEKVCEEQESFMKAQCAFTCQFCISKLVNAGAR